MTTATIDTPKADADATREAATQAVAPPADLVKTLNDAIDGKPKSTSKGSRAARAAAASAADKAKQSAPVDETPTPAEGQSLNVSTRVQVFVKAAAAKSAATKTLKSLAAKIDELDPKAETTVRVTVTDAELDVLEKQAIAMATASDKTKDKTKDTAADLRSANALVKWIGRMRADAAKK